MSCLCVEQNVNTSTPSSDDFYYAFQFNTVLFFGSTDLNVSSSLILESCRETIAIKADVSVDQVKNLTLTKKSTQRRFLRNLNVQVGYDLQFVIMFDNYTSSQDSVSALEDSLELDPVTKSKSPFAEMFFSTYVVFSVRGHYSLNTF